MLVGVNPNNARESLRAIEQAQLTATRYSENNGLSLLVWGAVIFVGLICFDVFMPMIAAIVLAALAGATALWQVVYARRLPVRPLEALTAKVIIIWSIYYLVILFGGTFGAIWLFHHKPPFLYTCIAILSAAPLLFFGARFWRRAHRKG